MPSKLNWLGATIAERTRMIEDIQSGRGTLVDLFNMDGLTDERLTRFIAQVNFKRKKSKKRRLPTLTELRAMTDTVKGIVGMKEQLDFQDQGNVGIATLTTCHPEKAQINNLFEALSIDKEEWLVERIQPNTWQVMTSVRGTPEIVTLYQMKAWLRRKTPIQCEWPQIQPITVNYTVPKAIKPIKVAKNGKVDMNCCLVITDSQNGYSRDMVTGKLTEYHDRRAWDIACQIAEKLQPNKIVLVGDHCDLPDWSDKFVRHPNMYWTTQPMLLELHWWLARLRKSCPNAEITYIEGNHEARMNTAITTNLIASWGLQSVADFARDSMPTMSIPKLLGLDALRIKYEGHYPKGVVWVNDNIKIEHGNVAKSRPQETARAILERARSSVVFGHIHRREVATKNEYRKIGSVTYMAECFGCICHLDGRVPAHDVKNDWNQGLGLIWYQDGNGLFRTEHVPIHEGVAIYGTEVLTGTCDLKKLSADCRWDFEQD